MRLKRFVADVSVCKWYGILTPARLFLCLNVIVFASLSLPGNAAAQVRETAIPQPGNVAVALQAALDTAKCYPPGTPRYSREDGKFGPQGSNTRSRQAIDNWLSVTGLNGSGFNSPQQLLDSVKKSRIICPTDTKNACRKDSIGAQYLKKLKGIDDVRRLSIALETTISNFDKAETPKQSAVFPPGSRDPVKLTKSNIARIKAYGVINVTPESTKRALNSALHNFDNLILSYALKAPECRNCAKINDWLYLRNIASANAGMLIAKRPSATEFAAFNVNSVTPDMMVEARPHIFVFRSITEKLNQSLAAGKKPKDIYSLIKQRAAELFGIVAYFNSKSKATSKTAIKMPELVAQSKCIGFTGSAIYQ